MLLALPCVGLAHGGLGGLRSTLSRARRARVHMEDTASKFKDIEGFQTVEWPDEWPFADERYFARADEQPDILFYDQPRFVTHIDDGAISSLTAYYAHVMQPGADVLDLCSSWISHLPADLKLGRVAGLGMNEAELSRNERLTERTVQE